MYIKSERFIITDLTMDMCNDYQKNSVDDDNRRFVPDEVCETLEEAEKTLKWLIGLYSTSNGPFVYPIITKENINIGYVQACPLGEDFEIGYHIAKKYTGNGFATEAVKIFLPVILGMLQIDKIYGIVLEENIASQKVLEKDAWKTVIITGANSGLGFEAAKKIAADTNFRLILACRNREKAENAAAQIITETGNHNILYMPLDTASLKSVRQFEKDYKQADCGTVYALLCNAGISGTHTGLTEDGYDVVFQTNHLGHFLLTKLMLPYMAEEGRIFITSSDMHDAPGGKMVWKGTEALAHPNEKFAKDSIHTCLSSELSYNEANAGELWEASENYVNG